MGTSEYPIRPQATNYSTTSLELCKVQFQRTTTMTTAAAKRQR